MLAIVAAVLFGIALVFQLAAFAVGPLTAGLLQTPGVDTPGADRCAARS